MIQDLLLLMTSFALLKILPLDFRTKWFLNGIIMIKSDLCPNELLQAMQRYETNLEESDPFKMRLEP